MRPVTRGTVSFSALPSERRVDRTTSGGIMEAQDRGVGPVDIIVIGYPVGAPMTGEAADIMVDLVDRGIIRVLDAMFVAKDADGEVVGFEARDLDDKNVGSFQVFDGASSGLLGEEDI